MTAVYRHFDDAGLLLYVGLSVNVAARMSAHSAGSEWFDRVARVEIEKHPTREDALNAEAVAIVIEAPRHNRVVPVRRAMRLVSPVDQWPKLRAQFRRRSAAAGMKTAPEIIDYIGQDALMAALNVQADAVRKARKSGVLPAAWYDAMERLAGRPLPRSLFSFKGAPE